MKIRDKCTKYMVEKGIDNADCAAVFEQMDDRARQLLDKTVDSYPVELLMAILPYVDIAVRKWMDDEAPRHWARGMFA